MAMETILSDLSVSMTEFMRNPNDVLRESRGRTVAVLSHNKPAFYMVPPKRYEAMLEELNDLQLVHLATERLKQKGCATKVTLDDL